MEINIIAGHGLNNAVGARGIGGIKEEVLNRQFAKELYKQLQEKGYYARYISVDDCDSVNDELKKEVKLCNSTDADLNIFVHFNCYNRQAKGSEVLTYQSKDIYNSKDMLINLNALGFLNRHIKDGSRLYVIRNTKAKSILIEFCFIDNLEDFQKLRNIGSVKMCRAIADTFPILTHNIEPKCQTCGK